MAHPFTKQRRALFIYIAVWLIVAVANTLIIRMGNDLSLIVAISDAVVSNTLFGLLGILVWYPTRYIPFQKNAPIYSITAHIAVAIIVIALWIILSISLLGVIFADNVSYNEILSNSILWRILLGAMIYLVMILVYYLVINARSLQERAKAEERLRTLVKETELNMLKSQINPHFLFNSLNSVSSLIMSNPDEAQEMIIRLSEFIRYSLKHRENEFVSLKEEIGRMEDYLAIEKVRFGDKLIYHLDTDEDCGKIEVPTMILQPLIENAIKHGVYESLDPVEIKFSCVVSDGFLSLQIENDFDPSLPSRKGTGIGLQNVSERIKLVYDLKGSVSWRIIDQKFIVKLNIPIEK